MISSGGLYFDREIVIYDQEIVRIPTNALEVTPLHIQQHHLQVASDVEQSTRGYEN